MRAVKPQNCGGRRVLPGRILRGNRYHPQRMMPAHVCVSLSVIEIIEHLLHAKQCC